MAVATMTSKGQITIPREIREMLSLEAGDRVLFSPLADGRVALVPRNRGVESIFGLLHDPESPVFSIDEMSEAIADAAAESAAQGLSE